MYVKVVKLHYKYIYKWHDKIAFQIYTNDINIKIDEIKDYQLPRWVFAPKVAWSIFAFSINEMSLNVYHLLLYLNGQLLVSYDRTDNISEIINNSMIQRQC